MIHRLGRAIALLLVLPFLAFASALAPQHVHEPGPGHDHDHAVAHSHFAPHDLESHQADGTEIEHDLEHVVWLDSPILHESPYRSAPHLPAIPIRFTTGQQDLCWSVTPCDAAAPAHGPPKRAERLRGPPPVLV